MRLFPAMLNLQDRRALIVGGGSVARRRAKNLLEAGAKVTVVAPRVTPDLKRMDVRIRLRPWRIQDLKGAFLVVVATDDAKVNRAVARSARRSRILINRADLPQEGDFVVPAQGQAGDLTLAVYSGAASASAAAAIRGQLLKSLDPAWPKLLRVIGPLRTQAQRSISKGTRRLAVIRRFSDPKAMALFKKAGARALRAHCRKIIQEG